MATSTITINGRTRRSKKLVDAQQVFMDVRGIYPAGGVTLEFRSRILAEYAFHEVSLQLTNEQALILVEQITKQLRHQINHLEQSK